MLGTDERPTGGASRRRLIFFLLLSLLVMVADVRYQYLQPLRTLLANLTYPLLTLANAPRDIVNQVGDWFTTNRQLQSEVTQLRKWKEDSAWQLNLNDSLKQENANLRQMLALQRGNYPQAKAAQVVAISRNDANQILLLNRGARDDVRQGQGVISPQGEVVGQVVRVFAFHSEVALINQPRHNTSVKFARTGLPAVATGGAGGRVILSFVPLQADVQVGDELITSSLDGIYPPGLPVATITKVNTDNAGYFYSLSATPRVVTPTGQVLILDFQPLPVEMERVSELQELKKNMPLAPRSAGGRLQDNQNNPVRRGR